MRIEEVSLLLSSLWGRGEVAVCGLSLSAALCLRVLWLLRPKVCEQTLESILNNLVFKCWNEQGEINLNRWRSQKSSMAKCYLCACPARWICVQAPNDVKISLSTVISREEIYKQRQQYSDRKDKRYINNNNNNNIHILHVTTSRFTFHCSTPLVRL